MKFMEKFNVFAILAAVLAIIGDFVPYYALPSNSNGIWHRYSVILFKEEFVGFIILFLAVLVIVFSIIRKRIPLIISTVLLILVEAIFIFLAFTEGKGVSIIDNNEEALLLQQGFYIAIWVEVLSIIAIIKSKNFLKNERD